MTRTRTQTIIELDDILREHRRDDTIVVPTSLLMDALSIIIQGVQELPPPMELLDEEIIFEGD